jgi:ribosomal protein S18 acetylase RimI-like enzyme
VSGATQTNSVQVRNLRERDIPEVVALQALAFPPPFDPDLLWTATHLRGHLAKFSEGQWVATAGNQIVGSCSNVRLSANRADAISTWDETVGGPKLDAFDPNGLDLYGLDISVHPEFQRQGIGSALYRARFDYVRSMRLTRYVTACRIPDLCQAIRNKEATTALDYVSKVVDGRLTDRTLTPLLRMGLTFLNVKLNYMDDEESLDAAALLEWRP